MRAFVWVAFTVWASAMLYITWGINLSVRHLRRGGVRARRRSRNGVSMPSRRSHHPGPTRHSTGLRGLNHDHA